MRRVGKRGEDAGGTSTLHMLFHSIFAIFIAVMFIGGCSKFVKNDLAADERNSFEELVNAIRDIHTTPSMRGTEVELQLQRDSAVLAFNQHEEEILVLENRDGVSRFKRPDFCNDITQSCLCLCTDFSMESGYSTHYEGGQDFTYTCKTGKAVCASPKFEFPFGGHCGVTDAEYMEYVEKSGMSLVDFPSGTFCDTGIVITRGKFGMDGDRIKEVTVQEDNIFDLPGVSMCPAYVQDCKDDRQDMMRGEKQEERPERHPEPKEEKWYPLRIAGGAIAYNRLFLEDLEERCPKVEMKGFAVEEHAQLGDADKYDYFENWGDVLYFIQDMSEYEPSVLVIQTGMNSMVTTTMETELLVGQLEEDLIAAIKPAQDAGVRVLLVEVPPIGSFKGNEYTNMDASERTIDVMMFNVALKEIADSHENTFVVPIHGALSSPTVSGAMHPDLTTDGFKLNRAGYELVNSQVYKILQAEGLGCN